MPESPIQSFKAGSIVSKGYLIKKAVEYEGKKGFNAYD